MSNRGACADGDNSSAVPPQCPLGVCLCAHYAWHSRLPWRITVLRPVLPRADFASNLLELHPEGVDVVLNSLTSPGMLAASLAVLKRGGAFIDVGKRDIWAAAHVAQVRQGEGREGEAGCGLLLV